jgi:hypothetical protein
LFGQDALMVGEDPARLGQTLRKRPLNAAAARR